MFYPTEPFRILRFNMRHPVLASWSKMSFYKNINTFYLPALSTSFLNTHIIYVLDFNNSMPPESCGFDKVTGEDKFCCSDLGPEQKLVEEPQLPLFLDKNSKAHPCMDQSSHCKKWIENSPGSCTPRFDATFGNARNSYSFMREVCQETCNQKIDSFRDSFRSDKCKKVIVYIS